MSTTVTTPAKHVALTPSSTYQSSPGRFRHPRLTEIIQRRSRVSLTSRDVQNASINAGVLLLTFVLSDVLQTINTSILGSLPILEAVEPSLILLLLRGFLVLNIIYCLRPVMPYARADDINDIPLTPTQRALLGLPPSASSTTGFITPPRYRRTSGASTPSTQGTDRRSISANYSSSSTSRLGFSSSVPQSTSRSQRRASGSSYANSPGSPLFYKAVTNTSDFDVSRSFNTSGFGLTRSQSMRERLGTSEDSIGPGMSTPSPTGRKAGGGGINYKWLYDKGGRLKRDSIGF